MPMKRFHFLPAIFFEVLVFITQHLLAQTNPISLDPENPHYFLYHSKPTILITSGEHYGAVLNLDFDYLPYLDEIKSKGLNLTRTFTGAYVEPKSAFNIANNSLAPASGRFICPWARSAEPGYANGGGAIARNDVYTLDKNGGLLAVQEPLVRKIVNELKNFDHVIYEICNEPYFGGVV